MQVGDDAEEPPFPRQHGCEEETTVLWARRGWDSYHDEAPVRDPGEGRGGCIWRAKLGSQDDGLGWAAAAHDSSTSGCRHACEQSVESQDEE